MKGQMEPERTETFDVWLVIELQVDVFDVCELGWALAGQTVKLRGHTCNTVNIYILSKGTANPYTIKHILFSFQKKFVSMHNQVQQQTVWGTITEKISCSEEPVRRKLWRI